MGQNSALLIKSRSPPLPDDRGAVGVNRTSYRDGMVVRENANGSSIRKYSYFDENGWIEVGDTTFNQENFPSERLTDYAWDLANNGFDNFKDSNLSIPYHLYVTLYDFGNTTVAVKPEDPQRKIASDDLGEKIHEFSQIKQNSRTIIRNNIDTIWQK